MPFTILKGLSVQSAGSQSGVWGTGSPEALNEGCFEPLDTMLAGTKPIGLAASNYALTADDVKNCMLRITGNLLANVSITAAPLILFNGFYYWENLTTGSFMVTVTTSAGSLVLPRARRGILFVDATNGPRMVGIAGVSGGADPIPVGFRTICYNAAAPAGWSAVAANDFAVKVVNVGGGGVTSGTLPYSTVFNRTATDSHAITIAEMPLHGHPFRVSTQENSNSDAEGGFPLNQDQNSNVGPYTGTPTGTPGQEIGGTGSGNAHSHGIDLRVQTAAFTLVEKN